MPRSKGSAQNIKKLETQIQDLEEKHKRALADYQNQQKRHLQEKTQYIKFANTDIIHKFLSVLDHLQAAAAHLNDSGLNMVIQEFHQLLESEGVTQVNADGQVFDPDIMECVQQVPGEEDIVVKVTQAGYFHDDHLIRPAKVEVGNGKSK